MSKRRGTHIDREKDNSKTRVTKRIQQEIDAKIDKDRRGLSTLPTLGDPDLFGDRPAYDKNGKPSGVLVNGLIRKPPDIA
jgi:hypothetical protein